MVASLWPLTQALVDSTSPPCPCGKKNQRYAKGTKSSEDLVGKADPEYQPQVSKLWRAPGHGARGRKTVTMNIVEQSHHHHLQTLLPDIIGLKVINRIGVD